MLLTFCTCIYYMYVGSVQLAELGGRGPGHWTWLSLQVSARLHRLPCPLHLVILSLLVVACGRAICWSTIRTYRSPFSRATMAPVWPVLKNCRWVPLVDGERESLRVPAVLLGATSISNHLFFLHRNVGCAELVAAKKTHLCSRLPFWSISTEETLAASSPTWLVASTITTRPLETSRWPMSKCGYGSVANVTRMRLGVTESRHTPRPRHVNMVAT